MLYFYNSKSLITPKEGLALQGKKGGDTEEKRMGKESRRAVEP